MSCRINLFSIKDNDTFSHQLVLIRGKLVCSNPKTSYPSVGRYIYIKDNHDLPKNWPINSFNEFKVLVRLNNYNNSINLEYKYADEKANLEHNLFYEESKCLNALNLVIFLASDSTESFQIESNSNGEKNDLKSAIKRFQTTALLWQSFTSDSISSYGLGRKTFRLDLDSNNSK